MAYCKNCGTEVSDQAYVCPNCGVKQNQLADDRGGCLWMILGFLFPIIGLILFIVWKDSKPVSAKHAGVSALISFILGIIFYIIYFCIIGVGLSMY